MQPLTMFPATKFRSLLAVVLLLLAGNANAVLEIEITQGVEGALPIAIVPFEWAGTDAPPQPIAEIVVNDLRRSGLFDPLGELRFPQQPASPEAIDFSGWRGMGIPWLVLGRLEAQGPDNYTVEFQLFDVLRREQVVGYSIPATSQGLRAAAHKVSDLIFEEITGQRGAFSTRIAFISTEGEGEGAEHTLQVADVDGYNASTIFTSTAPLLSPTWSPDGERIAYVSFENQRPQIFIQDVSSGERSRLPVDEGLTSAPAFSPDGDRLALTISVDGNPEVYVRDLQSGTMTRVTRSLGIDTEAVWTPDGNSLIFTSDRSGNPQLYRIDANGGSAQRLTFQGRYNSDADIAPDGEQIAMVHDEGDGFRIAVMDLDTGQFRVLTDGRLDESPSFAPNGIMIIYATVDDGRGVLAAVSADGRVRQRLTLEEGDVREPAWSPFRE